MDTSRLFRAVLLASMMFSIVGCDQVTKHIARTHLAAIQSTSLLCGALRIGLAENTGGFLSLGATLPSVARTALFLFGAGLGLLFAFWYLVRDSRLPFAAFIGAALFCSGGLSNLLDRIFRGGLVTDFMVLGVGPVHTGVFNLADVAIMIGCAVLVAGSWTGLAPRSGTPERGL
ncbi:MAG TPA: signal peptidase II [Candidatus Kryptonia bacterium]|nr:signal peptidase II [Candidatus Kryptonia bacterium]